MPVKEVTTRWHFHKMNYDAAVKKNQETLK